MRIWVPLAWFLDVTSGWAGFSFSPAAAALVHSREMHSRDSALVNENAKCFSHSTFYLIIFHTKLWQDP